MKDSHILILSLLSVFLILSCSTDHTKVVTLTTQVIPPEAGSISPSQGEFDSGTTITIRAEPNNHWVFDVWAEDHSGQQNLSEITMNSDKHIVAVFKKKEYPLEINVEGKGIISEQVIHQKNVDYPYGTVVELTAVPDKSWTFSNWKGDLQKNENPVTILVDNPKVVTAIFIETFTLHTYAAPKEGGKIKPDSGLFVINSALEIEAVPNEGWYFSGWEGDYNGITNPIELTMSDNITLRANFKQYNHSIYISVLGEGSVEKEVIRKKMKEYPYGTVVQLTPVPSDEWLFVKWDGDVTGNEIPKQVTVTDDIEITAVFEFNLDAATHLTRILTNDRGDGTYSEEEYVSILGIEVINDRLRMYYRISDPDRMFYIETTDMIIWTDPVEVYLPKNWDGFNAIGIFYHDGWKGYGRGDGMHLFTSDNGIHFEHAGKAFEWKLDTFYSFFFDENKNKYVAYGRVRSTGTGGWQNDMQPNIDRRGISFHSNKTWTSDWSNSGQIIADPIDYWDYSNDKIPDFYTPNIYWDNTQQKYLSLTTTYWRDKNRIIRDYRDIRGNTRTTGEIYPMIMESYDGINFSIVTEKSPVPLSPHRRFGYDPPWFGESNSEQTCPECYEIGQIHPFIRPIQFNGNTYIFYLYRDNTHYEKPNYKNVEHSIYVYRLN